MSPLSFFFPLALVVALTSAHESPSLNVIPYPAGVSLGEGSVALAANFSITVSECEADCDILQRGIDRYMGIVSQPVGSTGMVFRQTIFEDLVDAPAPQRKIESLHMLRVITTGKDSVDLQLGIDESYSLVVPYGEDQVATLTAATVWGALHGLETFAQLLEYNANVAGRVINWTPVRINDSPRFPWRGLMIDSARHFLTVSLLEKTIDTMAAMKLNVLHWHIVDAESFPYVSEKYPNLQTKSSYHPSATYSRESISHLVSFAKDRGVRLVPEFDTPGHTASIGQAYPNVIADCYDWLKSTNDGNLRWPMFNNVALDVTKSETKVFVENIIEEMSSLFSDEFFHIGGDEVDQDCWNAVPSILTWMQEHDYALYNVTTAKWVYDFTGLQGSWASFAQEVTAANKKKAVVWEESFTLGFDLAPDTVVQVWLPDDGTDVLQRIVESGHYVILSNGWYLDRQAPTCTTDVGDCPVHWMWIWTGRDMYSIEPLAPSSSGWVPTEDQAKLILGGEAASWGESVDDKNFDARVWSRAPGVAERLWSPSTYNDDWEIQPRLSVLACQLARRGVQLADTQPAFCDYYQDL